MTYVPAMIIALCAQKGGTGKSTLCINLAAEGVARGHSVLLVDADRQATCRTWGAVASEHGHPLPTIVAMDANMHRPGQLDRIAKGHHLVLIDTPARIGEVPASALMMADLALLPCTPSGADTWALAETLELVAKAQTFRPQLRTAIVINRKQGRTALGQGVRKALADTGVPILRTEIGQRIAFQEALHAGLGVTRYEPRGSAAAEICALWNEILEEAHGKKNKLRKTKPRTAQTTPRR
jgi:chromosome partitioning protein